MLWSTGCQGCPSDPDSGAAHAVQVLRDVGDAGLTINDIVDKMSERGLKAWEDPKQGRNSGRAWLEGYVFVFLGCISVQDVGAGSQGLGGGPQAGPQLRCVSVCGRRFVALGCSVLRCWWGHGMWSRNGVAWSHSEGVGMAVQHCQHLSWGGQ